MTASLEAVIVQSDLPTTKPYDPDNVDRQVISKKILLVERDFFKNEIDQQMVLNEVTKLSASEGNYLGSLSWFNYNVIRCHEFKLVILVSEKKKFKKLGEIFINAFEQSDNRFEFVRRLSQEIEIFPGKEVAKTDEKPNGAFRAICPKTGAGIRNIFEAELYRSESWLYINEYYERVRKYHLEHRIYYLNNVDLMLMQQKKTMPHFQVIYWTNYADRARTAKDQEFTRRQLSRFIEPDTLFIDSIQLESNEKIFSFDPSNPETQKPLPLLYLRVSYGVMPPCYVAGVGNNIPIWAQSGAI